MEGKIVEVIRRIETLSAKSEFAIVVCVAFGYFAVSSLYAAFYPSVLPPISQGHLQFLLIFESIVLVSLCLFLRLRGWTIKRVGALPSTRDTVMGLGLVVVTYMACVLVWIIVHDTGMHPRYPGSYPALVDDGLHLRTVVAASILNPVYEELFLCGYIVTALKERDSSVTAVNVSVAIRLVYHLYQGAIGVLTIIPLGLIFSWWYARTGRLWPVLVAHAVFDLTSLLQFVH
jgi:uncharacterized protein